jgi:prepilin-type N-terminal cleavage/methylation domain-containing protein
MMLRKGAFTLLEIMLVMVVIGIMATIAIPRLIRKSPSAKWESVLDEVNSLLYFARQEAISTYKVHRLHFTVKHRTSSVVVEAESDDPEKPIRKIYTPTKSYYFNPKYTFPETILIEAVYTGKIEQLDKYRDHAYCYVIPNGLVQEVFIHLLKEEEGKKPEKRTLKVSPFLGKFILYEGYKKPKRS